MNPDLPTRTGSQELQSSAVVLFAGVILLAKYSIASSRNRPDFEALIKEVEKKSAADRKEGDMAQLGLPGTARVATL